MLFLRTLVLLVAVAACTALAATTAGAELVETDATWPSLGSGSDGSRASAHWVDVEIADAGAPFQAAVLASPDEPPGPNTPAIALSFGGVDGTAKDGFFHKPPDTHMAVGTGAGAAGRVVMVTNSGLQIWDKTGTSLAGPTPLDTFLGPRYPPPSTPRSSSTSTPAGSSSSCSRARPPTPGAPARCTLQSRQAARRAISGRHGRSSRGAP